MYDMKKYDEPKPESKKRVRASQACVHCRKKKVTDIYYYDKSLFFFNYFIKIDKM